MLGYKQVIPMLKSMGIRPLVSLFPLVLCRLIH